MRYYITWSPVSSPVSYGRPSPSFCSSYTGLLALPQIPQRHTVLEVWVFSIV